MNKDFDKSSSTPFPDSPWPHDQAFPNPIGPRRPAPGENGFFYDDESGTISAGVVERIEMEHDEGNDVIVMCAVSHGEDPELILYVHEQCFYFNQDAIAYGVKGYKEKYGDE